MRPNPNPIESQHSLKAPEDFFASALHQGIGSLHRNLERRESDCMSDIESFVSSRSGPVIRDQLSCRFDFE